MPPIVSDRLANVHPQMLRVQSEGDRKKFVGRLVERSLELLSVTKQDAAFRMGYQDSGVVSRWCSGQETPLFHKLVVIEGFHDAWVVAIAEKTPGAEVETIVRVKLRVA
jgi:hypothetical protein